VKQEGLSVKMGCAAWFAYKPYNPIRTASARTLGNQLETLPQTGASTCADCKHLCRLVQAFVLIGPNTCADWMVQAFADWSKRACDWMVQAFVLIDANACADWGSH
jgi:hypothetical protein